MAVIAVLLVGAGIFLLGSMGGDEEEGAPESSTPSSSEVAPGPGVEGAAPEATAAVGLSSALAMVSQATAGTAKPLPRPVLDAWRANKTVVLLFVHDGGIDDAARRGGQRSPRHPARGRHVRRRRQRRSLATPRSPRASASIGSPPWSWSAPKNLDQTIPTASVSYGFQSRAERRAGRHRRRLQGPDARLPPVSMDARELPEPPAAGPRFRRLAPRPQLEPEAGGTRGLTPPLARGRSSGFITDVLVDLGFVADERARQAIEEARTAGAPARAAAARAGGDHRATSSRARSPSATASTTSTSPPTRSTWRRRT